MAPEMTRLVRRVTFVLLALAAAAVEVAAVDTRPVAQSLGLAAVWVAVAALVGWFVPVPAEPRQPPPVWVFPLLLVLGAAPFAVEPLRRTWTGDGYPLELRMVFGLRNVGLGLAVCSGWLLCLRQAGVVSLFLILFAAAMSNHPAVLVALGLYAAVGGAWLTLVHWAGLKGVLVAPGRAAAVEVLPVRQRLPWAGILLLVLAVAGGLALAVVGPKRAAYALGEWLPTSGGTGEIDPFARYGVGDGPEETAGDDARSAGMVETDRMIEDNKNSLIDAVSDQYGPPHKTPRDQERMVAAGRADVIQTHGRSPDNRRPSRDFATSRRGPKGDRTPLGRGARGLFEVEGRTPLHVRVVAYERYDPGARRWVEARKPAFKMIEAEGGDWMRVDHLRELGEWYRDDERHRLKAADMRDNLVPTPALLTRFRINKVNQPDYYEWDYDGVLALAGRKRTPPGVVVTTECRTLDPASLPESAFARVDSPGGASPTAGGVPDALRPAIGQLARAWAGDRPPGWPQIEAVLTKLREEYTFDRTAAVPPDHPAPVAWFLTESRRGPDYLFATAAALILRSLGYPARVCLGYYAAPAAYDAESGHTPVTATDLHVWPEVLLRDGHWLVVEPTPGYAVLPPLRPWWERALDAGRAALGWAGRHATVLTAAAVAVGLLIRRRKAISDGLVTLAWLLAPGRTWQEVVLRAVRVLERRGRLGGHPRAAAQTLAGWAASLRAVAGDGGIGDLVRLAEWAAYGPGRPPVPEAAVAGVCRRALNEWTLRRLAAGGAA